MKKIQDPGAGEADFRSLSADPGLENEMTKEEIYKRLNSVFRDVFDDDSLEISETTTADDIDDWDSLAQISLIAAIESEFGIRFDMKSALHMKSAGEIAEKIAAAG